MNIRVEGVAGSSVRLVRLSDGKGFLRSQSRGGVKNAWQELAGHECWWQWRLRALKASQKFSSLPFPWPRAGNNADKVEGGSQARWAEFSLIQPGGPSVPETKLGSPTAEAASERTAVTTAEQCWSQRVDTRSQ